jgi:hypothetical protein
MGSIYQIDDLKRLAEEHQRKGVHVMFLSFHMIQATSEIELP